MIGSYSGRGSRGTPPPPHPSHAMHGGGASRPPDSFARLILQQ